MEHQYERGWQRYGFDNQPFVNKAIHGSSSDISIRLAFNRGVGKPHISFATIPPDTPGQAIGMHVHRDIPTQTDVEEWYILIEGRGEMTFSNGDAVTLGQGDLLAIYPGTAHSFRAVGGPVRLISITPEMFTYPSPVDDYPETFTPRIRVVEVDETMNAVTAECTDCGQQWWRPADDREAATLPVWARQHESAGKE